MSDTDARFGEESLAQSCRGVSDYHESIASREVSGRGGRDARASLPSTCPSTRPNKLLTSIWQRSCHRSALRLQPAARTPIMRTPRASRNSPASTRLFRPNPRNLMAQFVASRYQRRLERSRSRHPPKWDRWRQHTSRLSSKSTTRANVSSARDLTRAVVVAHDDFPLQTRNPYWRSKASSPKPRIQPGSQIFPGSLLAAGLDQIFDARSAQATHPTAPFPVFLPSAFQASNAGVCICSSDRFLDLDENETHSRPLR